MVDFQPTLKFSFDDAIFLFSKVRKSSSVLNIQSIVEKLTDKLDKRVRKVVHSN